MPKPSNSFYLSNLDKSTIRICLRELVETDGALATDQRNSALDLLELLDANSYFLVHVYE